MKNQINRALGGDVSQYLENLVAAGFIARDYTWHIKDGKVSKLSRYRLCDNYIRFYLRYIKPHSESIKTSKYLFKSLANMPGWSTIAGLQFENLVLSNREEMLRLLNIKRDDIVADGPFFQRGKGNERGCQIDYLIQTKARVLYCCEIKFNRYDIKFDIIDEMKSKLSNLTVPRGFSCLPVLVHVNEVHDKVLDTNYFYRVINFSDLLEIDA